ncbi:hypothetical protein DFH09DRAFT_1275110 [Mycena vulgaris]|nr:hypothetical protein DFH09DRAFT_1275110 [Mycena vulgaris]
MTQIKNMALRHLGRAKLDAIEKIKLCEYDYLGRYGARDAYIEVCTREQPLTPMEFQALGMDLVLLIMQIRERIITNRRAEEKLLEENIVDEAIGREPSRLCPGPGPAYC